jgi:L-rhamnose mutarotase
MTTFKNQNWDREYKERLGEEVFEFLTYDPQLIEYLSDHRYVWNQLKSQARQFQLSDNSVFVLHLCKLFEGVLRLVAKDAGWTDEFNDGEPPQNVRQFFRDNRKRIEEKIDALSYTPSKKQDIKDKFFSVVNDFKDRHEAVHAGSLLTVGQIDNYDSILTKIREVVSICLEVGFISIGEPGMVSSEGTTYMKKQ